MGTAETPPFGGAGAQGGRDARARHGRRQAVLAMALAVVLAAPLVGWRLGATPFDDPGEGMHAEIARELWREGGGLDLRLNGVRYVDKPPLLYLLLAGAFAVAGPSETVARAVPALAGLVAVGATAWLGARLLGPAGGLLAAGALLTSPGFYVYARYVRPDMLFVAALTVGFALAIVGIVEGRRALAGAGLVAFALAALAKDPLGALAPPLVLALTLAAAGRLRPVRRWLPGWAVAVWLVVGFGWWVAAERAAPGFTWYTVIDNHVLNVARARHFPDEDVPLGAGAFLAVAASGAAPWIVAAALAVVRLARGGRWRQAASWPWLTLAVWAVGVLGLTALSPFRLSHYGLPAYPAVAVLAALGWHAHRGRRLLGAHLVLFAAIALACAVAWTSDGTIFQSRVLASTDMTTLKTNAAQAMPAPQWARFQGLLAATAVVFGLGGLALAAVAGLAPARARGWLVSASVLGTMLAAMPLVGGGLAALADQRGVRGLAADVRSRLAADDLVAHEGPLENSGALEWYLGRRPVIVDGRRSVLGFGATFADAAPVFWDGERLRRTWAGDRRVWLISTRPPERSLVRDLPHARLVAVQGGRWLYVNR
jgi:4-amino-4-deoxy-L-arabinose transferase-like glycosyltransferase